MIKGISVILIFFITQSAFAQLLSREDLNVPDHRLNDGYIIAYGDRYQANRQTGYCCCCPAVTFMSRAEPPLVHHFVRMSLDADTHFDFDKATLKPEGIAALNHLIYRIAALDPGYGMGRIGYVTGIQAVGHTDWVGSNSYNDRLGARRANTVRNYLLAQGIPGFINTQSMGELQPVADNSTAEGRALNRRVEVMVSTVTVP